MQYNIIVAFSKNRGIGINNKLPWNIPSDLKKFRQLTIGNGNNAVIMGKNTWLSLPVKYLKSRDNLVLSSSLDINTTYIDEKNNADNIVKTFTDVKSIIAHCDEMQYDCVWIIGGSMIYELFLTFDNIIDNIYVTYIDNWFECDTYFPCIDIDKFRNVTQERHCIDAEYDVYDRIYHRIR